MARGTWLNKVDGLYCVDHDQTFKRGRACPDCAAGKLAEATTSTAPRLEYAEPSAELDDAHPLKTLSGCLALLAEEYEQLRVRQELPREEQSAFHQRLQVIKTAMEAAKESRTAERVKALEEALREVQRRVEGVDRPEPPPAE